MKKTFTLLKGAPVVLLAAMLGGSCQKEAAIVPQEENKEASLSVSSVSGIMVEPSDDVMAQPENETYLLHGAEGKMGQVQVMPGKDGAEVRITLMMSESSPAPKTIRAEMTDAEGKTYSVLNELALMPRAEDASADGQKIRSYYSVTLPALAYPSGEVIPYQKITGAERAVFVLTDESHTVIAKAVIQ